MNTLAKFKKKLGITTYADDSYLVEEYLNPALDIISSLVVNDYWCKLTLSANTNEYDLTDTSIVNASVEEGVAKVVIEDYWQYDYAYNKDFWIKDRTTLYFPDVDIVSAGEFEFKYARFFKHITAVDGDDDYSEYIETNIPDELIPYVIKLAILSKKIEDIDLGSVDGGIEEKAEANIRTKYGSVGDRKRNLEIKVNAVKKDIKKTSYGRKSFYSIPVK